MRTGTLFIVILAQIASTNAFSSARHPPTLAKPNHPATLVKPTTELNSIPPAFSHAITTLRGGCQSKALQTLASSLRSGPFGIPALAAYALAVNLPLTLYRQAYSFSVGYGFSVLSMSVACALAMRPLIPSSIAQLTSANPSFLMLSAAVFYGLRLGSFLLMRELTVPSKAKSLKAMDKTPRPKRVILSANVSLFYALMTGPLMYALRSPVGRDNTVAMAGASMAWFGAILEAVADLQKWLVKRGAGSAGGDDDDGGKKEFQGPTGWSYSVVRHPNYLGEVLFWSGLFVGGAPSFGRSVVAWVGSALGVAGIWAIMTGATKRLEGLQNESYKGQEKYDTWAAKTKYPLLPFIA